jgi:SLOG family YspA-like protein
MTSRVLITGSRTWTDNTIIRDALAPYRSPGAVLVHGDARGADRIAAAIWRRWGLPVESHPADWSVGRAAGVIRNRRMVGLGADVCLAFIRDHSRGATHCAEAAENAGIPTRRHHMAGPSHQATRARPSTGFSGPPESAFTRDRARRQPKGLR